MRTVEIYSATDPENMVNRQVWYWGEFDGEQTPRSTEWRAIDAWAQGICARYPDVAITDRSDRDSGFLRSLLTGASEANPAGDHYFRHSNGVIIVREPNATAPWWLVTWLPDDVASRNYPGFTISSSDGQVPTGPSVEGLAEWASKQPWATGAPGSEPEAPAESVEVPAHEWSEVQRRAFEHNLVVGFTREPDGSFSFGVYSQDGELLQHGIANTWDDARLGMIENLYPPNPEDG